MTFIQCSIQLDSCSKVIYGIIIPDSDPFQSSHTPQLSRKHKRHAATIGVKHYSET